MARKNPRKDAIRAFEEYKRWKEGDKTMREINYGKINNIFADFLKEVEDSEDMRVKERIGCYENAVENLEKKMRKELTKYAFRRDETL